MRKLLFTILTVVALTCGEAPAVAASTVIGVTPAILSPPASALFGAVVAGTPDASTAIDDTFTFTTLGDGIADSQVSTMLLNGTQNIDFSSIMLDGKYSYKPTAGDPGTETWALAPTPLGDGEHSIRVIGTLAGASGSYSGTLNFQAVPEPATWAMMLIGFGAIGLSVRGRRGKPLSLSAA